MQESEEDRARRLWRFPQAGSSSRSGRAEPVQAGKKRRRQPGRQREDKGRSFKVWADVNGEEAGDEPLGTIRLRDENPDQSAWAVAAECKVHPKCTLQRSLRRGSSTRFLVSWLRAAALPEHAHWGQADHYAHAPSKEAVLNCYMSQRSKDVTDKDEYDGDDPR